MELNVAQMGPKMAQMSPKKAQMSPKMAYLELKMAYTTLSPERPFLVTMLAVAEEAPSRPPLSPESAPRGTS